MERVTSVTAKALLERSGAVIASGGVNVISVEAIRARSHDKWARTRAQVEEFVERAFSRVASPRDVVVALNDYEFLTLQPERSRGAALTLSANVLRETLTFFVGKADPSDLKLFQVTDFSEGQIDVSAIDTATLSQAGGAHLAERVGASAPPAEPVSWKTLQRSWQIASDGVRQYALALNPQPTWNVRQRVVSSFLLRHTLTFDQGDGPRTFSGMSLPAPVAGLANLQALDYAVELLDDASGHGAALHAPVFLDGLAHGNSRYAFLRALKQTDPNLRRLLILELVKVPHGFPPSRMLEVVALLSPYCRAVLARAPDERTNPGQWRRCGLAGVSLDCAHLSAADRNAQGRLTAFAAAAAGVGAACVGYGLGSRSLLMSAWAGGFTHIAGAAVDAAVQAVAPQRFQPQRLYGRLDERAA